MNSTLPTWKDRTQNQFGKLQIQVPWRSIQLLVPHRMRRKIRSKLRSRVSPTSSISSLQTSLSPADTLRSLQSHRWTVYDFQYLLLLIVGIFSLTIIESPGPLAKTAIFTALLISLLLPMTRQFFLPFLPIAGWLLFFYACQYAHSKFFMIRQVFFTDRLAGSFQVTGALRFGSVYCRHWRIFFMAPISAISCLLTRMLCSTFWLGFLTAFAITVLLLSSRWSCSFSVHPVSFPFSHGHSATSVWRPLPFSCSSPAPLRGMRIAMGWLRRTIRSMVTLQASLASINYLASTCTHPVFINRPLCSAPSHRCMLLIQPWPPFS
jgi:hypothetical protein